jgi:hypothetical protein
MSKRVPSEWYLKALDKIVRGRVEINKQRIVAYLKEHGLVVSFRAMHRGNRKLGELKGLGGDTTNMLVAWNELLRTGEVVRTRHGLYALPGIPKHVAELAQVGLHAAKLAEIERAYRESQRRIAVQGD